MKKRSKKLLAFLATAAMAVMMMGTVASAADDTGFTYAPISIPTDVEITLNKVIIMPEEIPVPAVGIGFDVVPGTPIDADTANGTYEVKAGIVTDEFPTVEDAIFASGTSKDNPADSDVITADYNSSCTKEVKMNFGDIEFTEPGVYRYIISERPAINSSDNRPYANTALGSDSEIILDVYITDDDGNLVYSGYTMVKADASNQENIKPSAEYPDEDEKTDKFVNEYPTTTVTLSKEVTGNQGSRDEWFKFTVIIETPEGTDTTTKINISGQTKAPEKNAATSYSSETMAAQNNVEDVALSAFADVGYDLYLQHGSEVLLQGIPEGCTVTIVETNNAYDVKINCDDDEAIISDDDTTVDFEIGEEDVEVKYINDKDGQIPTGIIISMAGLLIVGIISIIGFVFFGIRSKRRYEED